MTLNAAEPVEEVKNYKAYATNHIKKGEMALYFPDLTAEEIKKYVWIADSGASTYMYTQDEGFTNCHVNKSNVEVGKGSLAAAPKIGKWHGTVLDAKTKKVLNVCLNKTLLVPGLMNNLFSLTQAMANGCRFYSHDDGIRVELPNGKGVIDFNKRIKTQNGFVFAGI